MRFAVAVTAVLVFGAATETAWAQADRQPGQVLESSGKELEATGQVLEIGGETLEIGGRVLEIVGPLSEVKGIDLGIAGSKVTVTAEEVRIELPADILFDFDKSDIRSSAAEGLKKAAALLRERAKGAARIEGHTDSKGNPPYNQKLSERRSESVRKWLVEREGLGNLKFAVQGFGATRPKVPNTKPDGSDDPDGRQQNRRVEIVFATK
jgi:outer membrane protein OmpA-like peptidoglycan-associated protein